VNCGWPAPPPETLGWRANSASSACLARAGSPPAARISPVAAPLLVVEQRLQQVLRRDALVVLAHRDGLRRLQEALGAIGELLDVHGQPPL
jgi:hypothetical protein